MQRSKARAHIIRIRTGIHQRNRQFEVRILHRQHQRTRTRSHATTSRPTRPNHPGPSHRALRQSLHIRPRLQQRPHRVQPPLTHRKVECFEPGIHRRIDLGTSLQQRAHHSRVTLGCGPHQSGLAKSLPCLRVCTPCQQRLHRLQAPGPRSQHQRGFAALHRGVRVGTSLQQQLHNGSVAIHAGLCQRSHPIAIQCVHFGTRLHQ